MNNIYYCYQRNKVGCYVVASNYGEARKFYLSRYPLYDPDHNVCITNLYKSKVNENKGLIEVDSDIFKKYQLKPSSLNNHPLTY